MKDEPSRTTAAADEAAAPPPLPNGAPVVFGHEAVECAPQTVADTDARRVLLVRGEQSFEASGAARILPKLQEVTEVTEWSDFSLNPDADDLRLGLTLLEDVHPDLIFGIGGGSTLDMAKLLIAFARRGGEAGALHDAIRSGDPIDGRRLGLILAPTTSGSGSEATHFAVVYIGDKKFSVIGPALRPDAVILDPALTTSGPPYQRATSGIDAVCQAIESLWAKDATAESRRFADLALDHLIPALEEFVMAPTRETATAMALGSHLAGRAIDISKTTAAHALSYGITKRHGVSHGHAVALTLAAFMRVHDEVPPGALHGDVNVDEHRVAMGRIAAHLGADDGTGASRAFRDLMERVGLDVGLAAVGAGAPEDRTALAASVNLKRLDNNPVAFDQDALVAVLEEST